MQQWEAPGMGTKPMDDWVQAWIARSNLESQRAIADMNDRMRRQREANAAQFAHSMAVQQQMHDQFMQTMQEGHEHFMVQQQANQNARAASASDWVDFALDRQTVMNTNTGLVYKISNQYTINSPEEVQMHGNGTAWNSPQ
jgi:ABC-type proline/glycine betaine transport system ATPase subunit